MAEKVEFVCFDDTLKYEPEVCQKYGGQYIAAAGREIIAHGPDVFAVRREAAAKLGVDESAVYPMRVATDQELIAWELR